MTYPQFKKNKDLQEAEDIIFHFSNYVCLASGLDANLYALLFAYCIIWAPWEGALLEVISPCHSEGSKSGKASSKPGASITCQL